MTTVNLFSGGLDSFVAAKLLRPDVNLHVNVGERYSGRQLMTAVACQLPNFKLLGGPQLGGFIDQDGVYLRNRNALFLLYASYYGDEIILSSTEGDAYPDKSREFMDAMEKLFLISSGLKINISSPFAGYTKLEVVQAYKDSGLPMQDLDETTSCYHPTKFFCGVCSSCLRRTVALAYNNHKPENLREVCSLVWKRLISGTWSGSQRENTDTVDFLLSDGFYTKEDKFNYENMIIKV